MSKETHTVTQEFHISVTPLMNDTFLVRTERVEPGVPLAEEQIVWQLDDWLEQARQLMNNPLMSVLQPPEAAVDPSSNLVRLGQAFHNALFYGSLRDSWIAAQSIAQNRGEMLRLRLGLKGLRLPRLPWEVLHESPPNAGAARQLGTSLALRPLTTGMDVLFSRYQPEIGLPSIQVPCGVEPGRPLRILVAIAAPTDQERLNLRREALHLQQELTSDQEASGESGIPEIQIKILEQPGREQLTRELEQGDYQIFHYAGHSNLGGGGGNLYLVNTRTGLTETLSGDDLAGLLVNNNICLAVFNSCRGSFALASNLAEPDPTGPAEERNLAEALVSRGIPAVLAMAEEIPDNVALNLTCLFYRNLKRGYPIDLSLSRARQGLLSSYGSQQLYWALPVLYMHPEYDGYLILGDRSDENPADQLLLSPLQDELPLESYLDQSLLAELLATPSDEAELDLEPIVDAEMAEFDLSELEASEQSQTRPSSDGDTEIIPITPIEAIDAAFDEPELQGVGFGTGLSMGSPPPTVAPTPPRVQSSGPDRTLVISALGGAIAVLTLGLSLISVLRGNKDAPAPEATQITPLPSNSVAVSPDNTVTPLPASPEASPSPPTTIDQPASTAAAAPTSAAAAAPATGGAAPVSYTRNPPAVAPKPEPAAAPPAQPSLGAVDENDLLSAQPGELKAIAINRFEAGTQIATGQAAIKILLDRYNLSEAEAALESATSAGITDGYTHFLAGRLAWQAARTGYSDKYSFAKARQYWESALDYEPGNTRYRNALGFAYFAEGQTYFGQGYFDQAWDRWTRAIATLESTDCYSNPTGCAIQAVTYLQLASRAPDRQQDYLNAAIDLRNQVLSADPSSFTPDRLSQDWLWLNSAIDQWRGLLDGV